METAPFVKHFQATSSASGVHARKAGLEQAARDCRLRTLVLMRRHQLHSHRIVLDQYGYRVHTSTLAVKYFLNGPRLRYLESLVPTVPVRTQSAALCIVRLRTGGESREHDRPAPDGRRRLLGERTSPGRSWRSRIEPPAPAAFVWHRHWHGSPAAGARPPAEIPDRDACPGGLPICLNFLASSDTGQLRAPARRGLTATLVKMVKMHVPARSPPQGRRIPMRERAILKSVASTLPSPFRSAKRLATPDRLRISTASVIATAPSSLKSPYSTLSLRL
jgi:hypothetical protein